MILETLLLAATVTAAPARDPIEGKCVGMAGFPQDRIDVAFEFKRNDKGALRAFVYEPVLNFYGLDVGDVQREGDTYVIKDHATTLTLSGDTLEGTYLSLNAPASFRRTDTLPAELVAATSGTPSPLKSPTTSPFPPAGAATGTAVAKVPSPLPSSTANPPADRSIRSSRPSPLKSPWRMSSGVLPIL